MSIQEQNMLSISRRYPALAESLRHVKDDMSVTLIKKNPKAPTLSIKDGAGNVHLIHHDTKAVEESLTFVRGEVARENDKANIVVCFGLGLGYEFEALFNKYNAPMTQFIVIENNVQIFKKYVENKYVAMLGQDGKPMGNMFDMPNVHWVIGVGLDQMYNHIFDILHFSSGSVFTTFTFVEHPVLIRFNKAYYKPIIEIVNRVCYDIKSSFGNDPEDSWLGMDHMLQNTDLIASSPGIITLKDKFKDLPALIVATGPSLNKNIHLINKFKNKAVFFAADASVNTFMKYVNQNGIKEPIIPDMVTSLERSPTTHRHFAQVPPENWEPLRDTFLCACPVVRPDVYENWHGKYAMMYRDFSHFHWIGVDKGTLQTGKSVTNMAWKIAEYMGCNPIILAGQDLAFARDGQTHVKGADHASNGLKNSPLIQQKMTTMGYDGQPIETLDTWMGMKKRFEYDIAKNPNIWCINATEGGARIEGAIQMPLQEVLDLLTHEVDIKGRLDELMPKPTPEEIERDKKIIKERIDKGYVYLNWGINKIKDMMKLTESMMKDLINDDLPVQKYDHMAKLISNHKAELLNDTYCWYTMMHVMQSWLMGRDNILRSTNTVYKNRKELMASKLLKIYEMYEGLTILYNLVLKGTKEMYYDHPTEPKDLPDLQATPYERDVAALKKAKARQDMQSLSEGGDEVVEGGGGV